MEKNIAITGKKGTGKTTLARWLLARMGVEPAGFETVRYALTDAGPLYELRELRGEDRGAISERREDGIRGIPAAFDGMGVQVLTRAMASPAPVLLLDEIGRFEKDSPRFLEGLFSLLDSEKIVVAVLKQEELPHIRAIRQRQDTLVLDLDRCSADAARAALIKWLETL